MKADVVKIKAENQKGFAIIDRSAFDKKKHKLFVPREQENKGLLSRLLTKVGSKQ